jgi:hypothetical protein
MLEKTVPLRAPRETDPTSGDRRTERRHPSRREVFCCLMGSPRDDSTVARVHNISTKGIALLTEQELTQGTVVLIQLLFTGENGSGRLARHQPARVMRTTKLADGGWLLGCKFVTPLTRAELGKLLQPTTALAAVSPGTPS